ncbi:hypothetical protein RHMOL_Rhmol09G0008000 [Rhododendron molle]|uniref:Uncharacterized protein n=1 Tax=Rhododendron molle TaxID=49168 RepID=A0ACC0M9I7_RHOML|nr:hypothetical protein RHMOL_Rhmol09G0008000 [Rhododendron molle]
MTEGNSFALLNQLEDILDSDHLVDEVGFIHPSQFVTLNREAGGSLASSVRTTPQSEDGVLRPRVPEVNSSETVFWCRDHKLGISTQVLLPLYNAAKHAFMASLERYRSHSSVSAKKDESGGNDMSSCFSPSLNILESELMKHSRALLLLSCDFVTAWNSRKLVLSKKNNVQIFFRGTVLVFFCSIEVLRLFAAAVFSMKQKMNYRAWNHCCWLVSYMSEGQVLEELNRSRDWARLHIADNSCFHYRTEELDWNELLIKHHIGREHLSESLEIELQEKLPLGELKTVMNDICPEKLFLWHSLQGTCEST